MPTKISFGPGRLFGSVARCSALSDADASVLIAQQLAAKAALEHFVDDDGNPFEIIAKAGKLGDVRVAAIAHDIGCGIAHLYMDELGFHWVANAKEALTGAGQKPDYLYDRGASSHELALMEAKGSIGQTVEKSAVIARTRTAYTQQVEPWLGTTVDSRKIAHGFSIGTWARIANAAEIVICETSWPPQPQSGVVAAVSMPSTAVGLLNYSAVFNLVGAPAIAETLKKRGARMEVDAISRVRLDEILFHGRSFLVGREGTRGLIVDEGTSPITRGRLRYAERYRNLVFAVDLEVARSVLNSLRNGTEQTVLAVEPMSRGILQSFREFNEFALFADGLAYIPFAPSVRSWVWEPRLGLRADG